MKQNIFNIFYIIGNEPFLQQLCTQNIKDKYKNHEVIHFDINQSKDWRALIDEQAQPNIFFAQRMYLIQYSKPTLDAEGKKLINQLFSTHVQDDIFVFQVPQWNTKTINALPSTKAITVVTQPLSLKDTKTFIGQHLQHYLKTESIDLQLVDKIYEYTQNNLLAIHQCIQRMSLTNTFDEGIALNPDFELYELKDIFLKGDKESLIKKIRQAQVQKKEPTLVLWQFTDTIKTLINIHTKLNQNKNIAQVFRELNIWATKQALFQQAIKRFDIKKCEELLVDCQKIDEAIKSNISLAWHLFERLTVI